MTTKERLHQLVDQLPESVAPEAERLLESLTVSRAHKTLDNTHSTNPDAGVREARWLAENQRALQNYRNLWIGVLGDAIVASGASFDEVYDDVAKRGMADVLIQHVPDNPDKWSHLIA